VELVLHKAMRPVAKRGPVVSALHSRSDQGKASCRSNLWGEQRALGRPTFGAIHTDREHGQSSGRSVGDDLRELDKVEALAPERQ